MSATLQDVFRSFATFSDRLSDGSYMNNSSFAKLARDCGRAFESLPPALAQPAPFPAQRHVAAHTLPNTLLHAHTHTTPPSQLWTPS
jgi:hypothetical protein